MKNPDKRSGFFTTYPEQSSKSSNLIFSFLKRRRRMVKKIQEKYEAAIKKESREIQEAEQLKAQYAKTTGKSK